MIYTPIVDTPLDGDPVTVDGVPLEQFQAYLESVARTLNPVIYTVATVPDAALNQGRLIPVSDEVSGFTIAFSDGVDWRRVQDRVIIS